MAYRRVVAEGAAAVVRELAEHVRESGSVAGDDPSEAAADQEPRSTEIVRRVLSIGGQTELDRAAAEMVGGVLGEHGIGVRVVPPIAVSLDAIGQLELDGIDVVCISYLNRQPQVFARFVSRRLKRRAPKLKVLVCLWNPPPDIVQSDDLAAQIGADAVAFSLTTVEKEIGSWLEGVHASLASPMMEPEIPENEKGRLDALRELGLTSAKGEHFDALAKKVADAFDVPIALVTLVDETSQMWVGATGLPAELQASRQSARNTSICGHVVANEDLLVIEDVAKDERFANNPLLLEKGIRFYAGAPLRTKSNFVLGSLCVVDSKPRRFGPKDRKLLQVIADELMSVVEAEAQRKDQAALSNAGEHRLDSQPQALALANPV